MSLIEAARIKKLAEIELNKKEKLQKLAIQFQTSDQVGYAFNKIAIIVLISLYAAAFFNDFLRVCNYIGIFKRKNKANKYKPRAKTDLDDGDDQEDTTKANDNYDARFKLIEQKLFQSIFYKNQNKIGDAFI